MGKNQAYKAMQRARLGSTSAGPDDVEDGMVDGSFHSPEWHAARLASLKTSHTITWEEYKKKQKEDEIRKGELEKDTDKMMREYRAQLDAERAGKLSQGRNHSNSSHHHHHHHHHHRKRDRKDKDSKKRSSSSSKRRKHSRRRSSESSSSSCWEESCTSDEEDKESRRSKSRSKRSNKLKKHKSRTKHNGSNDDEAEGPLPLSRFFHSVKT
ncbi:hypothetical protein PanWU01x14_249930 [Parasponia andersonii]|uniref:Uncharacterized protein n=1 Tax=Parasponia andersonii TaxID=3476 RepID=A0A2P5BD33_PARAD|nr:hypothetical protein PanWU01x14_249930 [Parasponia andersonii]